MSETTETRGLTCRSCGAQVDRKGTHACGGAANQPIFTSPQFTSPPTYIDNALLERIAIALEKIAAAPQKSQILTRPKERMMPIEYTRQAPLEEREAFICALCEEDADYTGAEVVVKENRICNGCAEEVADQAGYLDRALKAERKVKEMSDKLNPYCRCGNQKIKDNGQVVICVNCGRGIES